jgi:phosphatidylserine/phosphatidylglycerophosphate/cardiolipin synthase-like enzyme
MGMDPIAKDENYEVTIVLEGPVKVAKYREFQDKLRAFLDQVATITNDHPHATKPKLQAREGRAGVRKSV